MMLDDCRWPKADEPYATALREAVQFARDRFDVMAVIACGSILRGEYDPTSDWDIHVIHAMMQRQRIQRRFHGVPAELFVNPPQSIRGYFRDEHENVRPCTAHMLATGWIVLDRTAIAAELVAEAQTWLAKKPEPSASKLTWLRYVVVDLLDNATDVRAGDPANAVMILNQAVSQMIEYCFWERGRFQPRAKAMLAALDAIDSAAARLARNYYTSGDINNRFELAYQLAQQTIGADTFFAWESPLEDVERITLFNNLRKREKMNAKIVVLGGDGIGPEVTAEAVKILDVVAAKFGHTFMYSYELMGGCAIDATGNSLPEQTVDACARADAVILGAVGGPKWDNPNAPDRPERGLLALRKALSLFANLRPVKLNPQLISASTIKQEVLEGTDMLVIRELTGGLYFGPRQEAGAAGFEAYDTMLYTRPEIERVMRLAADSAMGRRKSLVSVDKANVLASGRLWRRVATETLADYPELDVEHMLVDAMAMHLIRRPATFDVIVSNNMFGDILTDEASMLAGSMGMLPSASLGDVANNHGLPLGLYEPIHGSAPDIAGQGIANPLAMILSTAMLLRHSLGLEAEAQAIETAVDAVLDEGVRTADIAHTGTEVVGTQIMGDLVAQQLRG